MLKPISDVRLLNQVSRACMADGMRQEFGVKTTQIHPKDEMNVLKKNVYCL